MGRMKIKGKTVQTMSLRVRQQMIFIAGFSTFALVLTGAYVFTYVLPKTEIKASDISNRYPFELSSESLRKVNFTVLPFAINSNFKEVRPLISADEKSLFFNRRNHPDNINGVKDHQDIFLSSMQENGEWGKPVNAGLGINSKKADAICSVSPDGSEIYFFTEEMGPDEILFKSKRLDNGWSTRQAVIIEDFYNNDPFIDLYYSYEAHVLLLAVSRNDSKGGQDLYFSLPTGLNRFSKPQNLGIVVNTDKSDFAPFLAADGKTLYFSSYGHNGFGGCDIFKTTRLDETWQRWSKPVNLGEGINSSREESYFSITGNCEHIYFESYDAEKEVRDIFRADLPEIDRPTALNEDPIASTTNQTIGK
jgi:Tol biopolymer transport system component